MAQIVDWTGRRRKIEYEIDRPVNIVRDADIVNHQFEFGVSIVLRHIIGCACHQIIDGDDFMPFSQIPVTKVRSNKSRTTSNDYSHASSLDVWKFTTA